MRGQRERSGSLFSYVSIEERIPASHPLRRIRKLADQALDRLNPTFCELYAAEGRPSVPPEQLLLASLLQAFYGIRSERLLLEQLHYNLLFRWFVGLSPDDPIWHPKGFVAEIRRIGVTPHVAQNTSRPGGSAIDGRTTRHEGYAKSINARRGIEKVFAWIKQWGGLRQFKLRGTEKGSAVFGLHVIAYNLIRLGNLLRPAMAAA